MDHPDLVTTSLVDDQTGSPSDYHIGSDYYKATETGSILVMLSTSCDYQLDRLCNQL